MSEFHFKVFFVHVLVADSDIFAYPLAEPWARLVIIGSAKWGYSCIIAASCPFGKNILPHATSLLDVSPITDVITVSSSTQFVRPIYAGNALCVVRYAGRNLCMLTVQVTSFPVANLSNSNKAPISRVDLSTFAEDFVGKSRYVKHATQDTERPDLGSARVVVTGGRELKSPENFEMLEKLVQKLGAAVGVTRAAVDANFVPNDHEVGQTGKLLHQNYIWLLVFRGPFNIKLA